MKQHFETYRISNDYEKLYDLVNNGHRIVCFINYSEKSLFRDTAVYRGIHKYSKTWELTARGISYTQFDPITDSKIDFIKDCQRMKLDYIDSNIH